MASDSVPETEPGATTNDVDLRDVDRLTLIKALMGLTQTIQGVKHTGALDKSSQAQPLPDAATTTQNRDHPSILPPPQFDGEISNGLSMSRAEYIRRQQQVFEDLTGQKNSQQPTLPTEKEDLALAKMMELYMSALDSQVYQELEVQQRLNDVTEEASLDMFSQVFAIKDPEERIKLVMSIMSKLSDDFASLQYQTNTMLYQRGKLESQRTILKQRYAAELSRSVRLDHTVRLMSKKLIQTHERAEAAESAQRDAERALKELQIKLESLELTVTTLTNDEKGDIESEISKDTPDMASLSAKLRLLYREIGRLQKLESMKEIPDTPEKILARILVYVDNARGRKNQHVKDLIKAFLDLFETRERQLTDALAQSRLENQIYLARCDRLTETTAEQTENIRELLDRTVDLVLTDKQLREDLGHRRDQADAFRFLLEKCLTFFNLVKEKKPDLFGDDEDSFIREMQHCMDKVGTQVDDNKIHTLPDDVLDGVSIFSKLKGVKIEDIVLQVPGQKPIPLTDVMKFETTTTESSPE
ncbi:hypothetical protein B9G98_03697 [Wickerhamiella sorbophila]|uniref:Uncharacterized protein n=1 Tax=Wickerhamiella sorbophila TaxID=45607 RepID=A0A2T0FM78_9ASCO|nr:hypothetical protein B9G98_03697 [Wickerhamiella sorbophila]PRT56077.1 hypothetical protein B9G98_03697 [Wickerhamiella sorbophila]